MLRTPLLMLLKSSPTGICRKYSCVMLVGGIQVPCASESARLATMPSPRPIWPWQGVQ